MGDLSNQTIKGYEIHEQVGAGGFGAVYRAYQPVVGREVAIKVILPIYANHPDFIRRFESEAQLIARLEHPHIVPLFDYWREPGGAYLVMRWLRGGSLRQLVKRQGMLPLDRIIRILDQLAGALAVAHQQGVVHRDLKPDNILFDEYENAYLVDFGIAKEMNMNVTEEGVIVGSPAYLSPEQWTGELVTPKADIYSLGIVLYELVTGNIPFRADSTPVELLHKHLHEPIPAVDSPRLNTIIQKATAKSPQDRFPDVLSLAAAVHELTSDTLPSTERITTIERDYSELTTEMPTITPFAFRELVNPYKGLRAFQEADAADFFGRQTLVGQLLVRLNEDTPSARFLAVVGPSGSGKSSVVRAGLIPALRDGAIANSERAFIVEMFPGAYPLAELEAALLRVAINPPASLMEQLEKDKQGLLRAVKRILPPDEDTELFLVIDQFEEVFTLTEDEEQRAHFLDSLLTAVLDPRSRLRIIITLRADFYDRPLLYADFGDLLRSRMETVMPLNSSELQLAILQPAKQVGVEFEHGLAAAIVNDVEQQPGTLPLLQYALTELFERREGRFLTLAAYQTIDGVSGALARRADDLYAEQDEAGKEAIRQLFLRLITLGEGTEDTRRRVRRSEFGVAADQLIDAFGKARLLTFDRDPVTRGPTVEVAHEALIRQWGRLREWLATSREDVRLHRRLTVETLEWLEHGRDTGFLATGARLEQYEAFAETTDLNLNEDERAYLHGSLAQREVSRQQEEARRVYELELQKHAARRLRYLVASLTLFLIVAAGLSVFAFNQRDNAEDARATSVINAVHAQDQAATATIALGIAEQRSTEVAQQAATSEVNAVNAQTQAALAFQNAATATNALGISEQRGTEVAEQAATSEANLVEQWRIQSLFLADLAQQELEEGAWHNALNLVFESLEHRDRFVNPESHQALLDVMSIAGQERLYLLHEGRVDNAIWNADESLILTVAQDGMAKVWDAITGQERLTMRHAGEVNMGIWNHDESLILTTSVDGTARVWDAVTGTQQLILRHNDAISGAAWNADESQILTSSFDGTARVWDAVTGQEIFTLRHNDAVWTAAWNSDESLILTSSSDATARIWDAKTGAELVTLRPGTGIFFAKWNHNESLIMTGRVDGLVHVWDVATMEERLSLTHTSYPLGAVWNADESLILTWADDETARVWDATTGQEMLTLHHDDTVNGAVWNADESLILSWSEDNTVYLWDATTGEELQTLRHSDTALGGVHSAVWNRDESQILTSAADGTARVWDIATEDATLRLSHDDNLSGAIWNRDDSRVLTWSWDGTAKVWGAATGDTLLTLTHETGGLGNTVNSALWNADESRILTASDDSTAKVWDAATGEVVLSLPHARRVNGAAWDHSETRILTWQEDGTVTIWDAATGEQQLTMHHEDVIWGASWNHDDSLILTWSWDSTVRVWDAMTGEKRLTLHLPPSDLATVQSAIWNHDESLILTATEAGTAQVWDAVTGEERLALRLDDTIYSAIWNRDETLILTASADHTARIWDAKTGELVLTLPHVSVVNSAFWNDDESLILTTSIDHTARVWDAKTGEQRLVIRHNDWVVGAAWSSDESRILTWSIDDTARITLVDFDALLALARSRRVLELNNLAREQFFLPTLLPTATLLVSSVTPLPTLTPSITPTVTVTPASTPDIEALGSDAIAIPGFGKPVAFDIPDAIAEYGSAEVAAILMPGGVGKQYVLMSADEETSINIFESVSPYPELQDWRDNMGLTGGMAESLQIGEIEVGVLVVDEETDLYLFVYQGVFYAVLGPADDSLMQSVVEALISSPAVPTAN